MGCTFCATGTMGLTADLTAGEIVEQLVHARRVAQIRNIVFMVRPPPAFCLCFVCASADVWLFARRLHATRLPAVLQARLGRWCAEAPMPHSVGPSPGNICVPPAALCNRDPQGMGEPLNNYEAVRAAVSMMTDPRYFGL